MKFLVLALTATSASAFTGGRSAARANTRMMADVAVEEAAEPAAPAYPTLNGWTADESKFCWGLPGALSPMGDFDPVGLSKDLDLTEMKRFREAEVTHGRVAMTAVLGFLVAESFHPLFGGDIGGPAIRHLDQVREVAPIFFDILAFTIALAELYRSLVGWVPPPKIQKYFGGELNEDYYPGDIGFDPLGLKPTDPKEFAEMQTKELQNGRLAMLASMGFIVQEQVDEQTILGHFGM
eukprot:CAMPEP_0182531052 /NCGR_PEP_ID=MMETSP1323-20130603/7638_1 /TAXON_ID=236787 /ORGANISM="Florenciella parvula, Strain RCC1693" /LENGTH=236 /DNA_ID=CAMNT_0024740515 /DNA_START=33 /DNA_END=743 /DNA_ORIENTATION=+